VITRLTTAWQDEHRAFMARNLADRDYVYLWADGVHFNVRLEEGATFEAVGAAPMLARARGLTETEVVPNPGADGERPVAQSHPSLS
jgi:hypothetical protein